jgi:hypothetical protein
MNDSEKFDVVAKLGTKLEVMGQKLDDFMLRTDDFRKHLEEKIDTLATSNQAMQKFCLLKQEEKSHTFLKIVIAFLVPVIVLIFNVGMIYQRLSFLEKHSYGYQDAVSVMR